MSTYYTKNKITNTPENENAYFALQQEIARRLTQNPSDSFAFAAQVVLDETISAYQFQFISHALAKDIYDQTNAILKQPTLDKVEKYKELIHDTLAGKRNPSKIVQGALMMFLGAACFMVGLGLTLSGLGVIAGIPLKLTSALAIGFGAEIAIAGLGLKTTGACYVFSGREKDLKASMSRFFKRSQKACKHLPSASTLPRLMLTHQ
jgi:hypothetical protein